MFLSRLDCIYTISYKLLDKFHSTIPIKKSYKIKTKQMQTSPPPPPPKKSNKKILKRNKKHHTNSHHTEK